ncbi:helix-turn-helix domain-containing protein [Clostridium thermosuccinogenes]
MLKAYRYRIYPNTHKRFRLRKHLVVALFHF